MVKIVRHLIVNLYVRQVQFNVSLEVVAVERRDSDVFEIDTKYFIALDPRRFIVKAYADV
jgi:hypothetical protein